MSEIDLARLEEARNGLRAGAPAARPSAGARLLTAREVAELLTLTPETVLAWQRTGKLPAIRLPSGQIRFRPDELEAWLAEHSTRVIRPSFAIVEGQES